MKSFIIDTEKLAPNHSIRNLKTNRYIKVEVIQKLDNVEYWDFVVKFGVSNYNIQQNAIVVEFNTIDLGYQSFELVEVEPSKPKFKFGDKVQFHASKAVVVKVPDNSHQKYEIFIEGSCSTSCYENELTKI